MTKCTKRIRDFFEYALYKFTLYFLFYLLTVVKMFVKFKSLAEMQIMPCVELTSVYHCQSCHLFGLSCNCVNVL